MGYPAYRIQTTACFHSLFCCFHQCPHSRTSLKFVMMPVLESLESGAESQSLPSSSVAFPSETATPYTHPPASCPLTPFAVWYSTWVRSSLWIILPLMSPQHLYHARYIDSSEHSVWFIGLDSVKTSRLAKRSNPCKIVSPLNFPSVIVESALFSAAFLARIESLQHHALAGRSAVNPFS